MDIEKEATLQGWVPQEKFTGDPDKWVDADEFVKRGETLMPMIQHANKKLKAKVEELENTVLSLKDSVVASQESMEALKQFHAESTKAQVKKARDELLAELKSAKEEGNIDQEVAATAELSRFDAAQEAVKKESAPAAKSAPTNAVDRAEPGTHPVVLAWMEDNPWYMKDPEKTGLMEGVARKLQMEGSPLRGREFLDEAARVVMERLGESTQKEPTNKVESGRHTASTTSSKSGTSFTSLPAEAKAACDRMEAKVVGPNRIYKNQKEWREFYAAEYFKGN